MSFSNRARMARPTLVHPYKLWLRSLGESVNTTGCYGQEKTNQEKTSQENRQKSRQEKSGEEKTESQSRAHEAGDAFRRSRRRCWRQARSPRTNDDKLQDKVKKTMIHADENLKSIFGGKKIVSMFEMTKHVSKHLK
jgi:hypothetical protein